jgi:Rps23 Pro-64 3,4-dihydroxylase Tpa1-like proline 4-hydroxylase
MFINYNKIRQSVNSLKQIWHDKLPFRYIIIDDFLIAEKAEELFRAYPRIEETAWDHTTYVNQKNKFVKTNFDDAPILQEVFKELRTDSFRELLSQITEIDQLHADEDLFGAGLHQSIKGAFLDVHVDFNIHPKTGFHRRMNLLIYMNKNWEKSYNGYLELWDMEDKKQIEYIEPKFNRAVIFETNEVSFHGHPKPLHTPKGMSRKSISVYYYTKNRPEHEITEDHNTIYVNTQGWKGVIKNLNSALKATLERLKKS